MDYQGTDGGRDARRGSLSARNEPFSHVGQTNVARLTNTATLLNDGEVLIAGGVADKALITASVEFYSPKQHRFLMLPETSRGH